MGCLSWNNALPMQTGLDKSILSIDDIDVFWLWQARDAPLAYPNGPTRSCASSDIISATIRLHAANLEASVCVCPLHCAVMHFDAFCKAVRRCICSASYEFRAQQGQSSSLHGPFWETTAAWMSLHLDVASNRWGIVSPQWVDTMCAWHVSTEISFHWCSRLCFVSVFL